MKYAAIRISNKQTGTCLCCTQKIEDSAVVCRDENNKTHHCHPHCCPAAKKKLRGWVITNATFILSR